MDVRQAIKQQLKARGWSQNELAKRSSVPQPTINRYLAGKRDITSEPLGRIMDAMDMRIRGKK